MSGLPPREELHPDIGSLLEFLGKQLAGEPSPRICWWGVWWVRVGDHYVKEETA